MAIGISRGSRPCTRTQPQLRLDCSPATRPFSHTTTLTPCFVRNQAVDTPSMPAPMITTLAFAGIASGFCKGCDQVDETDSCSGIAEFFRVGLASMIQARKEDTCNAC